MEIAYVPVPWKACVFAKSVDAGAAMQAWVCYTRIRNFTILSFVKEGGNALISPGKSCSPWNTSAVI